MSAQCPRCGSPEIELAIEAFFRALGYLIAAPFVLLALLVKLLFYACRALVRWVSPGAAELANYTAPARAVALEKATAAARRGMTAVLFPVRWLYSVKDDLLSDEDRDVNPIALSTRLLLIFAMSLSLIIGVIRISR